MGILKKLTLPRTIKPRFERLFIHIAFVLASSYIAVTQIFTKHVVGSSSATAIKNLIATLIVALVLYVLLFLASRFFEERGLGIPFGGEENAKNGYMFLLFFLITLAVIMVAFLTFYPGGFSTDNSDQWKQVQTGNYSNAHPALQTLFIKLATLFWNNYTFVVFLQNLFFALAIAYVFYTLYKYNVSRLAIWIVFFLVVMNTALTAVVQHLWKDSSLIVFATVLTGQLFNLYFSKGKWIDFRINRVSLAVILTCTTIMRHNAMFFTLPLAVILLYLYMKEYKKVIRPVATALVLVLLIQGPLYTALNVEPMSPETTFQESIGTQMVILSNVYQKSPASLPAEAVEFMDKYVEKEAWDGAYKMGNYNSFKWRSNWDELKNISPKDMLRWTAIAIVKEPNLSFEAFRELTKWVWSVGECNIFFTGQLKGTEASEIAKVYHATALHQQSKTLFLFSRDAGTQSLVTKALIYSYGAQQLLLVLCGALSLFRKRRFAFMFVLPTLVHNLATMFLLSAPDKRIYQFNSAIILPMCLVLLTRERQTCEVSGTSLFGELGSVFAWISTAFIKIDRSLKRRPHAFARRSPALVSDKSPIQNAYSKQSHHQSDTPISADKLHSAHKEDSVPSIDDFTVEIGDSKSKMDRPLQ